MVKPITPEQERVKLEEKIDKLQQKMDAVKNEYNKWKIYKSKQDKLKLLR